jgi:hypothetical protein
VVTIHDRLAQGQALSFDTKEILSCLGPGIHRYLWAITDLDCTGAEAQPLCDAVEKARRNAKTFLLSWDELLAAAQKFDQTIEATFIAFSRKASAANGLDMVNDLALFPQCEGELIVRAIDSSFFEIWTKSYDDVRTLKKCFKDVREEDTTKYLAASAIKETD